MREFFLTIFTGFIFICCFLGIVVGVKSLIRPSGNGEKVGIIVKCSDTGIFIKTHECDLIRGGINNGNGSFGGIFSFTSENKSDWDILKKSLEEQKEVKITYRQEKIAPFRTETEDNMFLESIEILNKDKK